jgi:hypothetical protein
MGFGFGARFFLEMMALVVDIKGQQHGGGLTTI